MERLLSVSDLAEQLNVPKNFCYRLNSEKRGPRITRIGPQMPRYRQSDVDEWLATRAEEP